MAKPVRDLITVQALEQGWTMLLGGEPLPEIIEQLSLDPQEFRKYVKERVQEISEHDQAKEKAIQLGQLMELVRTWWGHKDDPKMGNLILSALKARREIILPQTAANPLDKADVIDLGRVKQVVRERKEREQKRIGDKPPEA